MAMTAKHYSIVTEVLGAYHNINDVVIKETIKAVVSSLCDRFEANDDKFNRIKFEKECGL